MNQIDLTKDFKVKIPMILEGYTEEDCNYYICYNDEDLDYSINVTIIYVSSRLVETNEIWESEIYLTAIIKWDGCSHFHFGDQGYIHMCGKHYLDEHILVMSKLWEFAKNNIKHYDAKTAE